MVAAALPAETLYDIFSRTPTANASASPRRPIGFTKEVYAVVVDAGDLGTFLRRYVPKARDELLGAGALEVTAGARAD